jgi:hypothetical protein
LLERSDPLITVDHQVTVWLLGRNHNDRRLLTAGCQRRQQPPMAFRPAHAQVLKTPLKLMEFQTHETHPLDSSTLHQIRSGIARQGGVVSSHPTWNQQHKTSTGIARYPTEVDSKERVNAEVPAAPHTPHESGYDGRKSNPDSALATPPASYGDAATGSPAYCRHVAVSQLDYRDGTSDGRCNMGASGQLA